jgi:glycine cleavage system transcriptional repressor
MKKIVVSVLGYDRPGIVASISQVLFENRCNIEDVNQTILQTEFAGFFIASIPEELQEENLLSALEKSLGPTNLSVFVKPIHPVSGWTAPESAPFVLTTRGPDRLGLVVGITEVMVQFKINIANLKAVFRGGEDPLRNIMIYEVDIPMETDQVAFRQALQQRAGDLGLEISLQHRDIFEAVHRI